MNSVPAPPRARLIALGASNLTLLLPTLVGLARRQAGGPVQVFAALGFGRSFGIHSKFLARSLPGIGDCGLWSALAHEPPLPATGVVMDVGNDILYDVDVPTILQWVEQALRRLQPQVQRLVVAGLPPQVEQVGRLRYGFVRTVLVPGCRVTHQDALRRAARLRAGLDELAHTFGAVWVPMRPHWYRFDPIHVRRRCWRTMAAELLGMDAVPENGWTEPTGGLRVRFARPQLRRVFGIERRAAQPSVRLRDGTTVATF